MSLLFEKGEVIDTDLVVLVITLVDLIDFLVDEDGRQSAVIQDLLYDILPAVEYVDGLVVIVELPDRKGLIVLVRLAPVLDVSDVMGTQEADNCFQDVLVISDLLFAHREKVLKLEFLRDGGAEPQGFHVRHLVTVPIHVKADHLREGGTDEVGHLRLFVLTLLPEDADVLFPVHEGLADAHKAPLDPLELTAPNLFVLFLVSDDLGLHPNHLMRVD